MSDIFEKFDLHGRTAIVTGGAGLLGRQFSLALAQAGANILVADLAQTAADAHAFTLREHGLHAEGIGGDVTDPNSTRAMAQAAQEIFGSLDILVNSAALDPKFDPANAGSQGANAFESYSLDSWRQALDVNLTGAFLCCQAASRPMLAQQKAGQEHSGVMINMSSIYGLAAPDQRMYQFPGQPERYKPVYYSVTKWGILGLTQYLAAYYAGKNIRVNAISPGGVYNGHDADFVKAYSARAVLGRMAEKDEMNGALLFLASDASKYMTGANLVVDGGWTAW